MTERFSRLRAASLTLNIHSEAWICHSFDQTSTFNMLSSLKHLLFLGLFSTIVSAHGRLKYPPPIGAPPETSSENKPYNNPIDASGADFPCKGKLKGFDLNTAQKTTFKAGSEAYFE